MKTIELNEQAVEFLKQLLTVSIVVGGFDQTSKGIMQHILSKLEDEKELPPVSLDEMLEDYNK